MALTRVPLIVNLSQRDEGAAKDSMTNNVFYDKNTKGDTYATKRPGLDLYHTGTTEGNGIYVYNNILFIFKDNSYTPTQVAL